MAQFNYNDDIVRTFTTGEAVAENALVILLSTGLVENADSATDQPIGHAIRAAAAGEAVGVRLMCAPSQNAIAAAAIAVGGLIFPTATAGKVDDTGAAGTNPVLGVAISAATAEDDIIQYIPIAYIS